MKSYFKKENRKELIIANIVFMISSVIFSRWDNFKRGLFGQPEIEVVQE